MMAFNSSYNLPADHVYYHNYAESNPPYATQHVMENEAVHCAWNAPVECYNVDAGFPASVPLYAPTPLPQQSTLLSSGVGTFPTPTEMLGEVTKKERREPEMAEGPLIVSGSDSISSHEKKRHYLECLEYYVTYLHQQLALVGAQPLNLERSYRSNAMTSRSIRTLLVHMENMNRNLHTQTLAEEQRFIALRNAVAGRASDDQYNYRVD